MTDLVSWLREQLDEDERVARELDNKFSAEGSEIYVYEDELTISAERVLAEVDAKRRIIDWVARAFFWDTDGSPTGAGRRVLSLLALPLADREGYREEWRPDEAKV